ncbi:MAG: PEP-CTERM sorting domain-containing protein, partial [Phormidium sp.]
FTANSEITTLSFQGDPYNKAHGFVIDGVSVVENPTSPTSVPEPISTLGLLAFGIFGATSVLKRKQQQKVLNSVVSN